MKLDCMIKRHGYWFIDFLKKCPVGQHFDDITFILENKNNSGIDRQKAHLRNLLNHAVRHSSFYSKYNADQLYSFPVVDKKTIRENYNHIIIPVSLLPWQSTPYHIQKTSGSTGVPLAVPMDTRKRNRRIAALKYFGKIAGYNSHDKLAQLRIWTQWHNKTRWQSFWENIYPVNCSIINDDLLRDLCNLIMQKNITALWGYASWFDQFAKYIERHKITLPSLRTIIAGSEMLEVATREKLKQLLNCQVVSRYSNEENGVLGQDRNDDSNYYLNHANYFFEFLKLESDQPAKEGELSRIVITDLFNYAFPLIRYDTGDTCIFRRNTAQSNGFPVISKIYGRRLDLIYSTNNTPIHPMAFARILKNYPQILNWQFIQHDRYMYEIKLMVSEKSDDTIFLAELKNIIGNDAQIRITYTPTIPTLKSGKRKPVVNLYKS